MLGHVVIADHSCLGVFNGSSDSSAFIMLGWLIPPSDFWWVTSAFLVGHMWSVSCFWSADPVLSRDFWWSTSYFSSDVGLLLNSLLVAQSLLDAVGILSSFPSWLVSMHLKRDCSFSIVIVGFSLWSLLSPFILLFVVPIFLASGSLCRF